MTNNQFGQKASIWPYRHQFHKDINLSNTFAKLREKTSSKFLIQYEAPYNSELTSNFFVIKCGWYECRWHLQFTLQRWTSMSNFSMQIFFALISVDDLLSYTISFAEISLDDILSNAILFKEMNVDDILSYAILFTEMKVDVLLSYAILFTKMSFNNRLSYAILFAGMIIDVQFSYVILFT